MKGSYNLQEFGYAFGCTGMHLQLAKLSVTNKTNNDGGVMLEGDSNETELNLLCPRSKKELGKTKLKDLPGLVAVLSFLKYTSADLGHYQCYSPQTRLTFYEVIGSGAYCSAILAKRDNQYVVLKKPNFLRKVTESPAKQIR
jgi:hypothetical protein